jgi:NAD(P)-dependent dehydrogenase (short-subunit alcohol dehydrogenase family)
MRDKVCMVTGANGGMGRAIASELARQGATVLVVCRSSGQGETLKRCIIEATGNQSVEVLVADLSDQTAIRHLAADFLSRYSKLHVLVNNAGAHLRERRLSVDGIELHLAINHLAWFLLTNLLLDTLKASAPSRVVNVASDSMADSREIKIGPAPAVTFDLDDLQSERHFNSMQVYGRSKLAMVMCGYALARHLEGTGVTVNALHPGLVASDIVDDIAPPWAKPFIGIVKRFLLTPDKGAQTTIYLASSPEVRNVTGKYFIKQKIHRSPPVSYDEHLQEQLWNASSRLVGLEPHRHVV